MPRSRAPPIDLPRFIFPPSPPRGYNRGMSERQRIIVFFCLLGCAELGIAAMLFFFTPHSVSGREYYEDSAKVFGQDQKEISADCQ
jgi:hypothetical protein